MATSPSTPKSEYQRGLGVAKDIPKPQPQCDKCNRSKGIPILPVRYAVAYNRGKLPALPAIGGTFKVPAGLAATGKEVVHTLRLLRAGYLYVWLNTAKKWQAWRVLGSTVLVPIKSLASDVDLQNYDPNKDDGKFSCANGSPHHLQRSRFFTVPETETSVLMGWSPTRLTQKQLDDLKGNHASLFQTIAVGGGAHTAPAENLFDHVADFATLHNDFYEHYRDFPSPPQQNEAVNQAKLNQITNDDDVSNLKPMEMEGAQYAGAYAGGMVAALMKETGSGKPGIIAAVDDPLGITQDLAALCQPTFYGDKQVVRQYWTDQYLNQIEEALISQGYQKAEQGAESYWSQRAPAEMQTLGLPQPKAAAGQKIPYQILQDAKNRTQATTSTYPAQNGGGSISADSRMRTLLARQFDEMFHEAPRYYTEEWQGVITGLSGGPWAADRVLKAQPASAMATPYPFDLSKVSDAAELERVHAYYQRRRAQWQLARAQARADRSKPYDQPYQSFSEQTLKPVRVLHAAWLGSSALGDYMGGWFIRGDIGQGAMYDIEVAKCLVGAVDSDECLQLVLAWLAKPKTTDKRNLLVHALSWNMSGEVATYFDTAFKEADALIQQAPHIPDILSRVDVKQPKEQQDKQIVAMLSAAGLTQYGKLDGAWNEIATSLEKNIPDLPKNIPEMLQKAGLFPRSFNVLTPLLTRQFSNKHPGAAALLTAVISFVHGEVRVPCGTSNSAAFRLFLGKIKTSNIALYKTLERDAAVQSQFNKMLWQKIGAVGTRSADRPHLFVFSVADIQKIKADDALAGLEKLELNKAGSIRPTALLDSKGPLASTGGLVLDILILSAGISQISSIPDYKKDATLISLVSTTIAIGGGTCDKLGRILVSWSAAKTGLAAGRSGIVAWETLAATGEKLIGLGKAVCAAGLIISALTDGYKAIQFLKAGEKARFVVFIASASVGLAVAIIPLILTVETMAAITIATLPLSTVLVIAGLIAPTLVWFSAPSELEQWARDSIFGRENRRKHLRDDISEFCSLTSVQGQKGLNHA